MRTLKQRWAGLGALLAGLAAATASWGCSVPVFRYALERWTPDAYQATVFHRGPLGAAPKELVEALDKVARDGLANLTVETVDLGGTLSEAQQGLWKAQSNAVLPWLVVRYPSAKEISENAWDGPLTKEAVRLVLDSPARRELVKRLGQGATAVWLLLEPGSSSERALAPKRTDAVFQMLEEASRKLEKTIKLPERDADDPPLRSDVPLKIAFSTLRVSRADPAEQGLVSLLVRPDRELQATNEPMMFAVFGRGRALPPLIGKQLSAAVLDEVADFVTGPCSCQVKEMNPGLDLLTVADWDGIVGDGRVVKDPELPALISLSQFAGAAAAQTNSSTNAVIQTNTPVKAAPANTATTNAPAGTVQRGNLTWNLLFVFGVGLIFLVLATFAIRARFWSPSK